MDHISNRFNARPDFPVLGQGPATRASLGITGERRAARIGELQDGNPAPMSDERRTFDAILQIPDPDHVADCRSVSSSDSLAAKTIEELTCPVSAFQLEIL